MPYLPETGDGFAIARAARGEDPFMDAQEARWLLIRTPLPDDIRVPYWRAWVLVSLVSASAGIAIIVLVLGRRRLRASPFNHYIVGLAIPDVIFSTTCVWTCAMHAHHGDYWDGDGAWMCDLQSAYTVFGAAGSMWVNVLIASEICRLSRCTYEMQTYVPTRPAAVWARLSLAYALVAAFSLVPSFAYRLRDGFPAQSYAVRGLNCLPVPYDKPSSTFLWAFTAQLMLFIPLTLIVLLASRTYALNVAAQSGVPPPAWLMCAPWCTRALERTGPETRNGSTRAGAAAAALPGSVTRLSASGLHTYFLRLLVVIGAMWAPFFVIWLVQVPYYLTGGHLNWFAGSWAHLQGLVSGVLYLKKDDIQQEVAALLGSLGGGPRLGTVGDASAAAAAKAASSAARKSKARRGHHRRRTSSQGDDDDDLSHGVLELGAVHEAGDEDDDAGGGGGLCAHTDEELMAALSAETRASIIAREQWPMCVVPYDAWVHAGRIPSHADGVTRPLDEARDVVIFVSHRWWRVESPDDRQNTKYALVSDGVRRIAAAHGIDVASCAIWIDFACVDQQDAERQAAGITSLLSYAARAHFLLVPVRPRAAELLSLRDASHPLDLLHYGERAWCRCELYVYLCLMEMSRERAHVYAYGRPAYGAKAGEDFQSLQPEGHGTGGAEHEEGAAVPGADEGGTADAEDEGADDYAELTVALYGDSGASSDSRGGVGGRRRRGGAARASSAIHALRRALGMRRSAGDIDGDFFRALTGEELDAARFCADELPSRGALTVEADRLHICALERDVRARFARYAVLAQKTALATRRTGTRVVVRLEQKQLTCDDAEVLCAELLGASIAPRVRALHLEGNMLRAAGVGTLMRQLASSPSAAGIVDLRLDRNVHLGVEGGAVIGECLALPGCPLQQLHLAECELDTRAGCALARGLAHARPELHTLNVCRNRLRDAAVVSLLEAAQAANRLCGATITLLVDGNPISRAVFHLAQVGHLAAVGMVRHGMAARV